LKQKVDANNSLDVSTLKTGTYFITINDDENKTKIKIIKK